MVRYNQLYHGSTHIGYISKNGQIVKKVYKGSELVYQLGFDPVTFNVSSSLQTFTVPLGVSKIHVDCVASKGWTYTYPSPQTGSKTGNGGNGGRVQCDLAVNGGETLYIMVGGIPSSSSVSYNASDIRLGGTALANRIIVAGGGGGGTSGYRHGADGGAGGGTTGASTSYTASSYGKGAGGGTQSAGGAGGTNSTYGALSAGNGQLGNGGSSNRGGNIGDTAGQAGAGGAGYYGGGGGIAFGVFFSGSEQGSWGCGGAGGSSYTNSNCSNVVHTKGYRNGAGYVTISFVS